MMTGVHSNAKLRSALAAGIARYGDRLPGLIAARLSAQRPARVTAVAESSMTAAPKLHRFEKHPGDRVLTSLPVGASYQIGNGPRWHIIEHPALRTTS